MKRGLVAIGVAGVLLVGVAPTASADPAPVDISQVAATPVEDLIFPEANADGSVVQRGKEFTLAADVFSRTTTPSSTRRPAPRSRASRA